MGPELNEIWSIQSGESYPAAQKNEAGFHVSTWNYFQDTLSREKSRLEAVTAVAQDLPQRVS